MTTHHSANIYLRFEWKRKYLTKSSNRQHTTTAPVTSLKPKYAFITRFLKWNWLKTKQRRARVHTEMVALIQTNRAVTRKTREKKQVGKTSENRREKRKEAKNTDRIENKIFLTFFGWVDALSLSVSINYACLRLMGICLCRKRATTWLFLLSAVKTFNTNSFGENEFGVSVCVFALNLAFANANSYNSCCVKLNDLLVAWCDVRHRQAH